VRRAHRTPILRLALIPTRSADAYAPGVGAERDDARQGIQSVENAMVVLVALERGRGPMTLTQISAAGDMAPNKAHRYLVSLGRVALVTQDPVTGRYDPSSSSVRSASWRIPQ
jgi:IclR helix-turn-helix domain